MADLQEFEKVLRDVVNSKRLSASKVNALTELCMKSIEDDVKLVSVLYRTHKTLPAQQKVFSLYAFDALSRAARHAVVKNNITVDLMDNKGNCATFLSKVEAVLGGLIEDMLNTRQKEIRDKTKKIVDIWTTNNTFSKAVLAGLAEKIKAEDDKAAPLAATVPTLSTTAPSGTLPAALPAISSASNASAPVAGISQALLALLNQATAAQTAAISNPVPIVATANPTPLPAPNSGLDLDAQRLLQQLAGKIQNQTQPTFQPIPIVLPAVVSALPRSPPPKPMPIYAPNLPPPPDQIAAQRALAATHASPVSDNGRFDNRPGGPRASRWGNGPDRSSPPRNGLDSGRRDDYRGFNGRGGPRGGPRGRDYSDRGGRDGRPGYGRDNPPPSYGGRERSRSPPFRETPRGRYEDYGPPNERRPPPRRDSPRRNLSPSQHRSPPGPSSERDPGLMAQSMARKDEFGREVRLADGQPEKSPTKASELAQGAPMPAQSIIPDHQLAPIPSSSAPSSSGPAGPSPPTAPKQSGLDAFDWAAFDGSPPAFDALGQAFSLTHGYLPSMNEIMELVMQRKMAAMMPGAGSGDVMGMPQAGYMANGSGSGNNNAFNNPVQVQQAGAPWGSNFESPANFQERGGGGRGRPRGRGGFGGGRAGPGYGQWQGRGGGGAEGYGGYAGQAAFSANNQSWGWEASQANGRGSSGGQSWGGDDSHTPAAQMPPPADGLTQAEDDRPKKSGGQMVKKDGGGWEWVPAS